MKITIEPQEGLFIISIEGGIGIGDINAFSRMLETVRKKSPRRVVVDLAGTTSLYSAAIGALIAFVDGVEKTNGRVVLAAVPAKIRDIFTRMGVECFQFAETVEQARSEPE